MAKTQTRFVFLPDIHWGYERKGGHKMPIHNVKALAAVKAFVKDFKPHYVIWGGDSLDCAAISHHNKSKHKTVEGLRIVEDAAGFAAYRAEIASLMAPGGEEVYLIGNHEAWLDDVIEQYPGLEGLLDVQALLKLPPSVRIVPQGGNYHLGKLWFIHGDHLSGINVARKAVDAYDRCVRFGHFHRFEAHTKHSALDASHPRTGVGVPCLCTRSPHYGKGAPNQWSTGFLYGYVNPDGTFHDVPVIMVKNAFVADHKTYG